MNGRFPCTKFGVPASEFYAPLRPGAILFELADF